MSGPTDDYNATLTWREELSPNLLVLRLKPDGPLFAFEPGQYVAIGLFGSSPRCAFSDPEEPPAAPEKLIKRAFSIASSSRAKEYVEIYVTLVRSGAFTPRLFALRVGDRLWLGPRATGLFTLDKVPASSDVILVATGTGLAPYMSMIRTYHRCNEARRFVVVHGARYSWDLGYRAELEALAHGCGTLVYLPTVSRPEQDATWRGHVGRVQSVFEDGTFEKAAGRTPDPALDHVLLCGNPEMVTEMQKLFVARGFTLDTRKVSGNVHTEAYW